MQQTVNIPFVVFIEAAHVCCSRVSAKMVGTKKGFGDDFYCSTYYFRSDVAFLQPFFVTTILNYHPNYYNAYCIIQGAASSNITRNRSIFCNSQILFKTKLSLVNGSALLFKCHAHFLRKERKESRYQLAILYINYEKKNSSELQDAVVKYRSFYRHLFKPDQKKSSSKTVLIEKNIFDFQEDIVHQP